MPDSFLKDAFPASDPDGLNVTLPRKKPRTERTSFISATKRSINRITGKPGARKIIGGPRGGLRSKGARSAYVKPGGKYSRRVVVKARYINGGKKGLGLHLKYITREGATREDTPGVLYNKLSDNIEIDNFDARFDKDTRQFRLIVSPEDASEIDLSDFSRRLMSTLETDLGTALDWVAANHNTTDNPHVHIVIRGVDDKGDPLTIAPEYISNGIRYRAAEILTQELGLRTDLDIRKSVSREVDQKRLTTLDRRIIKLSQNGTVNLEKTLGKGKQNVFDLALIGRLQKLSEMGLSHPIGKMTWQLDPGISKILQDMGTRGDIIKTLHHRVRGDIATYAIFDKAHPGSAPIVGEVLERGLHNELYDTQYLIIGTIDGRSVYVQLERYSEIEDREAKAGDIVSVSATTPGKVIACDYNIERYSNNGIYDLERHVKEATKIKNLSDKNRFEYLTRHRTRALHLERKCILQKVPGKSFCWKIPDPFIPRLEAHFRKEAQTFTPHTRVSRLSALGLEKQVTAEGPTWLDAVIARGDGVGAFGTAGFGKKARAAVQKRVGHLLEKKVLSRSGETLHIPRDFMAKLEKRELDQAVSDYGRKTGLSFRPAQNHAALSGTLDSRITLNSGEFAVVHTSEKAFTLVPWRRQMAIGKAITIRIHREKTGSLRLQHIRFEYEIGRQRGLSR